MVDTPRYAPCEVCRDPISLFVTAYWSMNLGTEDEPDFAFAHIECIDVLAEAAIKGLREWDTMSVLRVFSKAREILNS